MLTIEDDASIEEKLQWYLYQLKVWNKIQCQMHRAFEQKDLTRWVKCIKLMKLYGEVLSKDYEYESEKMMNLKIIFEEARDLI